MVSFTKGLSFNFNALLVYNLLLFFGLIVTLHLSGKLCRIGRDTDGSKFRRKNFWNRALVRDLIWGEKPSTSGDCTESDDRICHLSSWIVFGLDQGEKLSASSV